MRINSKLLFGLIIVFTIINIVDIVTAMFILPGEANPIYLLTQSIILLWIIKFIAIGTIFYIYYKNKYPSKFWFFSYVYLLVIGTLGVGLGAYSNIIGMMNPKIVEAAEQIPTSEKIYYYSWMVLLVMIIPYILSVIAFKIYDVAEEKIEYETKNVKL